MKEHTKFILSRIAIVLAAVLAFALIVVSTYTVSNEQKASAEAQIQVNGMPLDAIQYPAPTWMPDARQVFEVTDRKNNVKWWVIQVPNYGEYAWLVLPIGEYQDAG